MLAAETRKWHKWLFLFFGIQMLLWMVGGFYMVTVPLTFIHGDHMIASHHPFSQHTPPEAADLSRVLETRRNVVQITPAPQMGETVLEVESPDGTVLIDYKSDQVVAPPSESDIARIAQATYSRPDTPTSVGLLNTPIMELQGRDLPLWRVDFPGPLHPTLYFSAATGELLSRRHDLWRTFDFMWMLHIMDYKERQNINNVLLQIFAAVNVLAVIAGLVLVYFTLLKRKRENRRFKAGLVTSIHKWLGLVIGVQVLIWVGTGLGMGLIPKGDVDPNRMIAPQSPVYLSSADIGANARAGEVLKDASTWALKYVNGAPVLRVEKGARVEVFSAKSGALIEIDETSARNIAGNLYSGAAAIKEIKHLSRPGIENRTFSGPAWRVDFSDNAGTTLYLSAESGELQASRNNIWRVFDTFWMLHMMDYTRTNSFNSPWIIMSGLLSLLIGVSGVILILKSFKPADFVPALIRPTRSIVVRQIDNAAEPLRVSARQGDNLFAALQANKIAIASSCGGGGTCGQCVVDVVSCNEPPTEAEHRHLTEGDLADGKRLACQHRIKSDGEIIIPPPLKFVEAKVLANRRISSGMHELVVQLPLAERFTAGQHRYFDVPAYRLEPDEFKMATGEPGGRRFASHVAAVRSYSMSAPAGEATDVNSFIVRQMPAAAVDAPPGVGATYLCSRKPGDIVMVSDPRGAFSIRNGAGPVVFIGGGAGMAPLRAMLLDLLNDKNDQRDIIYFYGARSADDLIYKEEIEALAGRYPNFSCQWAVSPGANEAGAFPACHIHELAGKYLRSDEGRRLVRDADFYLCGPPAMLAATRSMLSDEGVASDRIFVDDFGI